MDLSLYLFNQWNDKVHYFQEMGRCLQRSSKWTSWLEVGRYEPVIFMLERLDMGLSTTAGQL